MIRAAPFLGQFFAKNWFSLLTLLHFFKKKFIQICTKIVLNFCETNSELHIDSSQVLNYNKDTRKSSELLEKR